MADTFGLKIGLEGEKEFKKSIAEINQTFKVLGSEMKVVSSQFDKNDKSVEALTSRNEVLNKQIQAQKDKIVTLKAALDNAASSFGENDKRTQQWQIQLNNAQAALNNMEREVKANNDAIDKASDEYNDARKNVDKFGNEVESSAKQTDSAGEKFKKVGGVMKSVGVAIGASVAAIGAAAVATGKKLWNMANETAIAGDEVDKVSQRLGLSSTAYQEWDYVLGQSGVEITSMTTGLKTLTNQLDDAKNGSASAIARFEKLGLSMSDLGSMSREEVFDAVIKGMQGMEDSTERAALANDLFGKSGQNLTPLFNQSAEATQQLKDAANELGFVMSDKAVKASAGFRDSLDTLSRTFTGVKNNLTGELLPGFTQIMYGLSDMLVGGEQAKEKIQKGTEELVESLQGIFPRIVDILMTLIGAIAEIAPLVLDSLIQGIVNNLQDIVSAASKIVVTFLESLISALPQIAEGALQLVLQLVSAILENLPLLVDTAMQVVSSLLSGIASALPTLIPTIIEALLGVVDAILNNLGLLIDAGVQIILGLIQGILDAIPMLIEKIPELISTIVGALIEALPILIEGVVSLIDMICKALPEIISAIIEMLPTLIETLISAIIELLPVVLEGILTLITGIVEALPELIESIVTLLPELINTIVTAVVEQLPVLVQALVDFLPQLIQGLIQIVMGIVSALPQIIQSLLTALPTVISSLLTTLLSLLPQLITGLVDLVSQLLLHLPEIIAGILNALPSIISTLISALIGCIPQLVTGCIQLVMGLVQNLPQIIASLIKAVPTIITSVVKALLSGLGKIVEVGKNIVQGLWDGIKNAASWLWDKVSGWLGDLWDGVLGFFGIASPSKRFRDVVGKNLVLGLAKGITDEGSTAINAAEDLAKDISDVNFSPGGIDYSSIATDINNAIPKNFDAQVNASVVGSANITAGGALRRAATPTFNNTFSFGNVTINNGDDIENIAHKVSDIIVSDIMIKGGAYT